jgi:cyanophycinase-like exopeptidase
MKGTVIDTHFSDRDRMGRLMTFMARQLRDGITDSVLGIGIDEGTSLVVNPDGIAQVMGEGAVYFVLGDHIPEECEPQTPLTFSNYKIWKRENGEKFDLKHLPSRGYRRASVNDGIV